MNFSGVHNPKRADSAGVYHGFKCISGTEALVLNCPTEPYNYAEPDEFRLAPHAPTTRMKIPYDWGRKDG